MSTKSPRLNITLEKNTVEVLTSWAQAEHKSISSLAQELILEALELREDKILSNLAQRRDVKDAPLLGHQEVWN